MNQRAHRPAAVAEITAPTLRLAGRGGASTVFLQDWAALRERAAELGPAPCQRTVHVAYLTGTVPDLQLRSVPHAGRRPNDAPGRKPLGEAEVLTEDMTRNEDT